MKKDNIIQDILDRILNFKKTKDISSIENYWGDIVGKKVEDEDDKELSRKLHNVFTKIQKDEVNDKQDNHLQELVNKVDYSESDNIFIKPKLNLGKQILRVAAVIIPLAIITSLAINYFGKNKNTSVEQIVTTQKGSKTKIVLEDGTIIWLNAESELRYPSSFCNKDKRVVNLIGEAYFDVAKNKKKPFEVYVSGYKIHVLGTSFNVKAYPNQKTFETTLEEGKIDIEKVITDNEKKPQKITLIPNQTIVLYNENNISEKVETKRPEVLEEVEKSKINQKGKIIESEDLSQYTSWKENELVFKSKSLGEVIPDLERWYNIEIEVEQDSLKDIVCTARFNNETAEQAIRALCIASKIKFEIDKNNIVLKAN